MTANTTQYYGRARYLNMLAEDAKVMGSERKYADLCAQRDKVVADDLKAGNSLIFRILPYLNVVVIGGLLAVAAAAINSVPEKQYDADGRQIIHIENYNGAGIDLCRTNVYSVYENGKPMKCPTPQ